MKYIENRLGRQLILVLIVIFDIILLTIGILIPRTLDPLVESTIYTTLRNPLEMVGSRLQDYVITNDIAYLYVFDNKVYTSSNYSKVIDLDIDEVVKKANKENGKINKGNKKYYYSISVSDNSKKIAIVNDTYFRLIRTNFMTKIIFIFLLSFSLIGLIVVLWSMIIVKKIEKLKVKVDNIDNDNYDHEIKFKLDDEIKSLGNSIEEMRLNYKAHDKERSDMYQNISHDFKTPLTVIKSYIEAVNDGVENEDEALKVIGEQTDKLEKKVYTLLYLNKLDYLKNDIDEDLKLIDIGEVINSSIEKFKFARTDVKISASIDNSNFYGTFDLWETIIDNILNNFIRYAKNEIKITVKKNVITLYNDGPKIDEKIVNEMFSPYKKGLKGNFGLGLSIVKKTLNLLGYDINAENKKIGVAFIIKKRAIK